MKLELAPLIASVFTSNLIFWCFAVVVVVVVETIQFCMSLNSPPINVCDANVRASLCLFSLLFSPLSKQCQYRLMVSLSDSKHCSLWLECVTTRFTQADSVLP